MRLVVINLDRSTDRLCWFQAQAAAAGLTVERLPAVDGRRLPPDAARALLGPGEAAQRMTTSEVACFLSHRRAWENLAESRDEWLAIFEDDAHLAPGGRAYLDDPRWIPRGVGIVKIETFFDRVGISKDGERVGGGRRLHRLLSMHAGSAGYILSRAAARRLLDGTARLPGPVDQVLFDPQSPLFQAPQVRQLVPALCVQDYNLALTKAGDILHPSTIEHLDDLFAARVSGLAACPAKRALPLLAKLKRELLRPLRQLGKAPTLLSPRGPRPVHTVIRFE